MTADFLELLARGTLAASAAIVVVLLARKPLREAFGARIAYAFWLIVPMAALAVFLPARQVAVEAQAATSASAEAVAAAAPAQVANVTPTPIEIAAGALATLDFSPLFLGIWLGGFLLSLAILLLGQQRFLARIGMRLTGDGYAQGETGPAVVGVMRPRIVLPADFNERYNETERALVIAHERAHIAAWDVQINALAAFAQCLNWFNPLLYMARVALRIDQELACDERVMARHAHARRAYAEAMLKTQLATQPIPLGCYWPPIGAGPLKQRIAMLGRPRPSGTKRALGAALCAAVTLLGGVAVWAAQPARPAYAEDNSSFLAGVLGDRLVEALQQGDTDEARQLIGAGANVNHMRMGDGTPLIAATRNGDEAMVRLLLEKGANVNQGVPGDGSALISAAGEGRMNLVRLYVEAGADVNGFVWGDETPLIAAARDNRLDAARYLIEHGADVNLTVESPNLNRGREMRSPMMMARRNRHDAMIALLRQHGARD